MYFEHISITSYALSKQLSIGISITYLYKFIKCTLRLRSSQPNNEITYVHTTDLVPIFYYHNNTMTHNSWHVYKEKEHCAAIRLRAESCISEY